MPAADPDVGDHGEPTDGESDLPGAAAAAVVPPQPGAAAPLPALPAPSPNPATPRTGSAFYLSDKELMESQSGNDEGEVER
jgi:hypothetical protein